MAFKVHQIRKYNYAFDARAGDIGKLQLWGDLGKVADINFVDDTALVPAPVLASDLDSATAYFKRGALHP